MVNIKAPTFPESVQEGTLIQWYKKSDEHVSKDDHIADIETDKVVLEVFAPESGALKLQKQEGDTLGSEELIATIDTAVQGVSSSDTKVAEAPVVSMASSEASVAINPSAKKMMQAHSLDSDSIQGSGKKGRISKDDVILGLQSAKAPIAQEASGLSREIRRVPMSRIRKTIAKRLLQAKQDTAMLTTFNEVNLHQLISVRKKYKDQFQEKHNIKLGFMSFFVQAAAQALQMFPEINAFIEGDDVIHHDYEDIGVAIASNRGLVVPVLRNVRTLSIADIESQISDFAAQARAGSLAFEAMQGGTFTITNGGVFGSLLSTPILNPPQSAILGMHATKERPIAENGQVVIRPMMYLALSYDHRMVDGKEAVLFLRKICDFIEDPVQLLLKI